MPGFSGQGKVLIGTSQTVAGIRQPGLLRWLGNASLFKVGLSEDSSQRNESYTGLRSPLRKLTKARGGNIEIKFDEFTDDNTALGLVAAVTAVSSGAPVTNYAFPSGAKVGSILAAPAKNLSAVSVKDSAGSPATLVLGTDYTLDAFAGTAELLNLGTYVQPFKMNYTAGAYTKIGALSQASVDVYLQFVGINTDDQSRCVVDIFRARLKPTKEFTLINDDYVDFDLEGDILIDTGRVAASAEGQFFVVSRA